MTAPGGAFLLGVGLGLGGERAFALAGEGGGAAAAKAMRSATRGESALKVNIAMAAGTSLVHMPAFTLAAPPQRARHGESYVLPLLPHT